MQSALYWISALEWHRRCSSSSRSIWKPPKTCRWVLVAACWWMLSSWAFWGLILQLPCRTYSVKHRDSGNLKAHDLQEDASEWRTQQGIHLGRPPSNWNMLEHTSKSFQACRPVNLSNNDTSRCFVPSSLSLESRDRWVLKPKKGVQGPGLTNLLKR